MLLPSPLTEGRLVRRYKRFLADVVLPDGQVVTAHCPNSGAMTACAEPGWRVLLSRSDNPKRKLPWTWELVFAGDGTVPTLVNTARPNHIVREGIEAGRVPSLAGFGRVRAEVRTGTGSRIDLRLEDHPDGRPDTWVEVKSVTLWTGGRGGAFPDAVTARGRKHLEELMELRRTGDAAVQFFLVSRTDIFELRPADWVDPAYGRALREAAAAGVQILAHRAAFDLPEIRLGGPVPVHL